MDNEIDHFDNVFFANETDKRIKRGYFDVIEFNV